MRHTDRGRSGAPLSERIQQARDIRDLDLDRWALDARALEDRVAQLEDRPVAQRAEQEACCVQERMPCEDY